VWVSSIMYPSRARRHGIALAVYRQAPPPEKEYKVTNRKLTKNGEKFARGAGMFLNTRKAIRVLPGVVAYFGDRRGGELV